VKAQGKRQARKSEARQKPTVTLVGAGKLAGFLAPALGQAGYRITEIVARERAGSMKRARALARRVGARAVSISRATLDADVLWLAVPDDELRRAAEVLARRMMISCGIASDARTSDARSSALRASRVSSPGLRFAFHSSGALGSGELASLQKVGASVASVHPLMTFVPRSRPSLAGVPFAVEGNGAAIRAARAIVRELGANSFVMPTPRKAAYHAWATMTSPLLLAYLVTLEEVARAAGFGRVEARRMSLPIMRQTLENYARLGPGNSFSGPFVRGDAETVERHLALLGRSPKTRAVYVALALAGLDWLPVKNRKKLLRLLKDR
jgi:predicted short-subunit dehydrogenase-like oxidoreductase (DUF2520 family)